MRSANGRSRLARFRDLLLAPKSAGDVVRELRILREAIEARLAVRDRRAKAGLFDLERKVVRDVQRVPLVQRVSVGELVERPRALRLVGVEAGDR